MKQALAIALCAIVAGCVTSTASSVVFPGNLDLRPLPGHWIDDCGPDSSSACIYVSTYRDGDQHPDTSGAMDAYVELLRSRGWELVDSQQRALAALQRVGGDGVARCVFVSSLAEYSLPDGSHGKAQTREFVKFSLIEAVDLQQTSSCQWRAK